MDALFFLSASTCSCIATLTESGTPMSPDQSWNIYYFSHHTIIGNSVHSHIMWREHLACVTSDHHLTTLGMLNKNVVTDFITFASNSPLLQRCVHRFWNIKEYLSASLCTHKQKLAHIYPTKCFNSPSCWNKTHSYRQWLRLNSLFLGRRYQVRFCPIPIALSSVLAASRHTVHRQRRNLPNAKHSKMLQ